MNVEPHVAVKDPKVRGTLQDYFGIEIGAEHPLLERIGLLHLAGGRSATPRPGWPTAAWTTTCTCAKTTPTTSAAWPGLVR